MSENPFANKPTIVSEVEDTTDTDEDLEPHEVQEEYEETTQEVDDEENIVDEEWAATPVGVYSRLDQDEFWWVFVSLDDSMTVNEDYRPIPTVEDRFESYDDLADARDSTEKTTPEGIHVQMRNSSKLRYVKGKDEEKLLSGRGIK